MSAEQTKSDIRAERDRVYGDVQANHRNIGLAWTAILRSRFGVNIPMIDNQTAELMMAAFKVVRAARPMPRDPQAFASYMDSYPDAQNYLDFAREVAEEWTPTPLDGGKYAYLDSITPSKCCSNFADDIGLGEVHDLDCPHQPDRARRK